MSGGCFRDSLGALPGAGAERCLPAVLSALGTQPAAAGGHDALDGRDLPPDRGCRVAEYMQGLFELADRFVVIYASNTDLAWTSPHVRHRCFTEHFRREFPDWRLAAHCRTPTLSGRTCRMRPALPISSCLPGMGRVAPSPFRRSVAPVFRRCVSCGFGGFGGFCWCWGFWRRGRRMPEPPARRMIRRCARCLRRWCRRRCRHSGCSIWIPAG